MQAQVGSDTAWRQLRPALNPQRPHHPNPPPPRSGKPSSTGRGPRAAVASNAGRQCSSPAASAPAATATCSVLYRPASVMTESVAESYHSVQAQAFAATGAVQLITGVTITCTQEAIGVSCAPSLLGTPPRRRRPSRTFSLTLPPRPARLAPITSLRSRVQRLLRGSQPSSRSRSKRTGVSPRGPPWEKPSWKSTERPRLGHRYTAC